MKIFKNSLNIRILHLVKAFDIGGVEKSTILYSNELVKKIEFIGIYAPSGFYDMINSLDINIKRFRPPIKISNYLFLFINFVHLYYTIKQNKITHIHYHHRIYIPFVFLLKYIVPSLKVYYTHHSCFNDKLNKLIIGNKIVALNEATKNDLPPKKRLQTVIIPHGVQSQNLYLKKSQPKIIGFVGRYVKLKGIYYLLDEFKIIKSIIPDAQLHFYGKGPEEILMKEYVRKYSLEESVYFLKPQNELSNIYKNIDLLVLPSSKIEGFGLVILEAFSYGVPVVVKNLSIYDNLVVNNYNGIITNERFSDSIIELFNDTIFFNLLRQNAISSITKNYELQAVIKSYISLYN